MAGQIHLLHIANALLSLVLIGAASTGVFAADDLNMSQPVDAVDSSVRPGDDFYRFANGVWLKNAALPAGKSSFETRDILVARNRQRVRDLLERISATDKPRTKLQQQVGDYFASLVDEPRFETNGLSALNQELNAINEIAERASLSAYLGAITRIGDSAATEKDGLFAVWVHQGLHQADHNIVHLQQGGLGLPRRDDYLGDSPEKADLRGRYTAYLATIFNTLGLNDSDKRAARVLALETAIAKAHASEADTGDVFKTDNSWTRADFDVKAAGIDWSAYFKGAGLADAQEFAVWQPGAITGAAALVATVPIETWKDYLSARLIDHYAPVMAKAFREPHLDFAGQKGKDKAAIEERAIAATEAVLGEAVGQIYVARYFPPAAKAAARDMIDNILAAYRVRLASLSWMTPETRAKTQLKLDGLIMGLGYPDHWTDISTLKIVRGDALGNLKRAEHFRYQQQLVELRQPVDPGEWPILPQRVNAEINFSPNSIQLAATLLQPPFFDYRGDAAGNYGSAGAGISHEISHSFDELGNLYDAQGDLVGLWWSAADTENFKSVMAPLVAQFDRYCPLPDQCVNGSRTLRENLGDLRGLMIAHDAYLMSLKGKPAPVIGGLTGEQRFFLAYAQRWRKLQNDNAMRRQLTADDHALGEYRSDAVRNLDAWYDAFAVGPDDKLYLTPEARLKLW